MHVIHHEKNKQTKKLFCNGAQISQGNLEIPCRVSSSTCSLLFPTVKTKCQRRFSQLKADIAVCVQVSPHVFLFVLCITGNTTEIADTCLIDSGSSKDKVSSLKPNSCFTCSSICATSTFLSDTVQHKRGLCSVSRRCTWL